MTWSIVARDPVTGAFGVAVTTKFFAVGALCPHAMSGAGALATQALINPTWGPRGLRMLADELPASEVVRWLVASDDGRAARQLHVVDRDGNTAAHTGTDCIGWCGHRTGQDFSVAGNMLTGAGVVEASFASFGASGKPLAERFLDALDAGQAEGGDKRGRQSAALIIFDGQDYPALSLRVDDHPEPLAELRRLYGVSRGRAAAFAKFYATRDNPAGIWDRNVIEQEVARLEAEQRAEAG
jgi:uncharacterized Ntn-hydrolase superfamily protein